MLGLKIYCLAILPEFYCLAILPEFISMLEQVDLDNVPKAFFQARMPTSKSGDGGRKTPESGPGGRNTPEEMEGEEDEDETRCPITLEVKNGFVSCVSESRLCVEEGRGTGPTRFRGRLRGEGRPGRGESESRSKSSDDVQGAGQACNQAGGHRGTQNSKALKTGGKRRAKPEKASLRRLSQVWTIKSSELARQSPEAGREKRLTQKAGMSLNGRP